MKKSIAHRLAQVSAGLAAAGVAGFAAAADPLTATDLSKAISWSDATTSVLVGSAAIIAFKVLKQAAMIVMGLIPKAK